MRVVKIEFTSLVADATSLSGFVYLMVSLMEVIMKKKSHLKLLTCIIDPHIKCNMLNL
jgi:hypothetical protein